MRKSLLKFHRVIPLKSGAALYAMLTLLNVLNSAKIFGAELNNSVFYSDSYTILDEEVIENFLITVYTREKVVMDVLICPARNSDGSFTEYDVYLNNARVTSINPTSSGWHNIIVPVPISLNKGENVLGIGVRGHEVPDIGYVRTTEWANENGGAASHPIRNLYGELSETPDGDMEPAEPLLLSGSNETVYKVVLPYTFTKLFRWNEGEIIDIHTTGELGHMVDLYIFQCHSDMTHTITYPTSAQMQGLNWRAESEIKSGSSVHASNLKIRVPKSGFYLVTMKPQSLAPNVSGLVEMTINSELTYQDCAISSCRMIPATMMKNKVEYEVFVKMNDAGKRPLLRIEGNAASRVVGSSIQCPSDVAAGADMATTDAYLRQTYYFSPEQICLSAYTPASVGNGTLLIRKYTEQSPTSLKGYELQYAQKDSEENVSRISVSDNRTIVIAGDDAQAWDGILLTDMYGKEVFRNMQYKKAYDVSSVPSDYYTICLIQDGKIIENKKIWLH